MSVNASARVVAPGANRAARPSARLPHPPAEALPLQCPVPSAGRASRNLRAARRAGITIAAAADVGGAAFSVADCEVTYGLVKERGPRGEMEDEATVVPSASLGYVYTGVFDGHGGYASAEYLKENLHVAIEKQLAASVAAKESVEQAMVKTFEKVDKKLIRYLYKLDDPYEQASGATGTIALVRPEALVVANVGDSRAVLSRGGRAVDLTEDHRVFGNDATVQAEVARVESVGGWVKDGRVCTILAVSRAFGDYMFKGDAKVDMLAWGEDEGFWNKAFSAKTKFTGDPVNCMPHVTEVQLAEEDEFVIVATDGLWDVLSSTSAVAFVRDQLLLGIDIQEVAKRLVTRAVKKKTTDNTSVVILDLGRPKTGWVKTVKRPPPMRLMNVVNRAVMGSGSASGTKFQEAGEAPSSAGTQASASQVKRGVTYSSAEKEASAAVSSSSSSYGEDGEGSAGSTLAAVVALALVIGGLFVSSYQGGDTAGAGGGAAPKAAAQQGGKAGARADMPPPPVAEPEIKAPPVFDARLYTSGK